jgi:hypothetical protein
VLGADAIALRLEDRHVDVEIAAADLERLDQRVDHADRLGVRLVHAAEGDAGQGTLARVRVGVALDVVEGDGGEHARLAREHRDDGGALRLAVVGGELRGLH